MQKIGSNTEHTEHLGWKWQGPNAGLGVHTCTCTLASPCTAWASKVEL